MNQPDDALIHKTFHPTGPRRRALKKKKLDQMVKAAVAEPETTEWASPTVFVHKKDGCIRFCVDYRRLNVVTEKDDYLIARMDKCLDSLSETGVLSNLDASPENRQVETDDKNVYKTSFLTYHGLFR